MGNNPSVVTENFSTLAKAEEGKPINDHAFWIPLFYEAEVLLEGPVKVRVGIFLRHALSRAQVAPRFWR